MGGRSREEALEAFPILKFFAYEHLPEGDLQTVSSWFCDLAFRLGETFPVNAETSAALRKLLEAKDCAVRARIL
jgi:hypothetical protein